MWNSVLDRTEEQISGRLIRAYACSVVDSQTFCKQEQLKTPCDLYGISVSDAEFSVITEHLKHKIKSGHATCSFIMDLLQCGKAVIYNKKD